MDTGKPCCCIHLPHGIGTAAAAGPIGLDGPKGELGEPGIKGEKGEIGSPGFEILNSDEV